MCLDVINQTWSPMYELLNVFEVRYSLAQILWRTRARVPIAFFRSFLSIFRLCIFGVALFHFSYWWTR